VIGALISAGSKLLGGFMANKAAQKARRQAKKDARNKFVDLRKAATKGGFNPLTALQATGGAGYGAGAYPSSAPPLASIDYLVDGLTGVGEAFTRTKEHDRVSDRFNREMSERMVEDAAIASSGWAKSGPFRPAVHRVSTQPSSARVPKLSMSADRVTHTAPVVDGPRLHRPTGGTRPQARPDRLAPGYYEQYSPAHLLPIQDAETPRYDDRPQEVKAEQNIAATNVVRTPDGYSLYGISEEAFESEPFQIASDGAKALQYVGRKNMEVTAPLREAIHPHAVDALKWIDGWANRNLPRRNGNVSVKSPPMLLHPNSPRY